MSNPDTSEDDSNIDPAFHQFDNQYQMSEGRCILLSRPQVLLDENLEASDTGNAQFSDKDGIWRGVGQPVHT